MLLPYQDLVSAQYAAGLLNGAAGAVNGYQVGLMNGHSAAAGNILSSSQSNNNVISGSGGSSTVTATATGSNGNVGGVSGGNTGGSGSQMDLISQLLPAAYNLPNISTVGSSIGTTQYNTEYSFQK